MSKELSTFEKSLIENINKTDVGKENPIVQLNDETVFGRPRGWIDTGVYSLNWIMSGRLIEGGWAVGRIAELFGDPGTGKSLLCEMAMKDPTVDLIIYFDTEAAINKDFLNFLGVDPSKILYQPIDTIEQLQASMNSILDTIVMNKQLNKKVLVVIDSIAMASTEKEMNPDAGSDMGYKARELRKYFRSYARKIEKYNMALLATNHVTQKIGVMFGNPRTTTGGTALPYASSIRLELRVAETEIDKKLEAIGASSVTIKAKTEKNRFFSPKKKVTFVLDFNRGVNRYSGLFTLLKDYGILEGKGWYNIPRFDPDKKFQKNSFIEFIKEHNLIPLIQDWLDEAVQKKSDDVDEVSIDAEEEVYEQDITMATEVTEPKKGKKSKN